MILGNLDFVQKIKDLSGFPKYGIAPKVGTKAPVAFELEVEVVHQRK